MGRSLSIRNRCRISTPIFYPIYFLHQHTLVEVFSKLNIFFYSYLSLKKRAEVQLPGLQPEYKYRKLFLTLSFVGYIWVLAMDLLSSLRKWRFFSLSIDHQSESIKGVSLPPQYFPVIQTAPKCYSCLDIFCLNFIAWTWAKHTHSSAQWCDHTEWRERIHIHIYEIQILAQHAPNPKRARS